LQVFGVTPTVSSARRLLVPSVPVIQPRDARFRVAVVIVPDALTLPAATCSAAGTRAPGNPVSVTVRAFAAAHVSVTVTVADAPPGTDAGDRVIPRSAGEQVAGATAAVRVYLTARAGCTQTITAAAAKKIAVTARIDIGVLTR